jgi:hypothetical protein
LTVLLFVRTASGGKLQEEVRDELLDGNSKRRDDGFGYAL